MSFEKRNVPELLTLYMLHILQHGHYRNGLFDLVSHDVSGSCKSMKALTRAPPATEAVIATTTLLKFHMASVRTTIIAMRIAAEDHYQYHPRPMR